MKPKYLNSCIYGNCVLVFYYSTTAELTNTENTFPERKKLKIKFCNQTKKLEQNIYILFSEQQKHNT